MTTGHVFRSPRNGNPDRSKLRNQRRIEFLRTTTVRLWQPVTFDGIGPRLDLPYDPELLPHPVVLY
jgi:hypothetical protein